MACEPPKPATESGDETQTKIQLKDSNDSLTTEQQQQQPCVGSVSSIGEVVVRVNELKTQYQKKSRYFTTFLKGLEWIDGFHKCVTSYLQASPPQFVIVWGSLSFLLEASVRYLRGLEQLAEAFQAIQNVVPRLDRFRESLLRRAKCPELEAGLLNIHEEVLGFCKDANAFFKGNPFWNFFVAFVNPLKERISPRVKKIKALIKNIDNDASAIAQQLQLDGVDDITSRLQAHREETRANQAETRELLTSLASHTQQCTLDYDTLLQKLPFRSLPQRPNTEFFGRETELEQLVTFLTTPDIDTLVCSSLYGLPGCGKTQLALKFAHDHIGRYDAILWVAAEDQPKISESFHKIAHGLGLVDDSLPHSDKVRDVMERWFEIMARKKGNGDDEPHHPIKWLLVFDNVEDLKLIEPYWPVASSSNGTILITCKNPEIARQASTRIRGGPASICVQPFPRDTSSRFLLNLVDTDREEDEGSAMKIAQLVGDLPLALDLVGCFIRECGMTIPQFIREHPAFERELLLADGLGFTDNRYAKPMISIWTMSRARLSADARLFMSILALLDGDGVPSSLFTDCRSKKEMLYEGPDRVGNFPDLDQVLETPFDESLRYSKAKRSLLSRSLIQVDSDRMWIKCHRLVALAVVTCMEPRELSLVFHKLVFFLNASFPRQAHGEPLLNHWRKCEELASQVQALLETFSLYREQLSGEHFGEPILLCELICRCSWYFYEKGHFQAALEMVGKGFSICERALKTGFHPGYTHVFVQDMVSHLVNVQAAVAREKPDLVNVLGLAQQVCEIREKNKLSKPGLDPGGDGWILMARGNLAVSLMTLDRMEEALKILLEILRLLETDDVKHTQDIHLSNAALCFSRLGQLDKATDYINGAIKCVNQRDGADETEALAICYFYLSGIREAKNDISGAHQHLQRCLRIRTTLKPHHYYTGFTHYKMGVLEQLSGRHESAIQCFEEALETLSSSECHRGAICRTRFALASSLEKCGKLEVAEECRKLARREVQGVEAIDLGEDAAKYDRFVPVGLR